MSESEDLTYLAGDFGGTKTNLALFTAQRTIRNPLYQAKLRSGDYSTLGDLVRTFLKQAGASVDYASFAVAGPRWFPAG